VVGQPATGLICPCASLPIIISLPLTMVMTIMLPFSLSMTLLTLLLLFLLVYLYLFAFLYNLTRFMIDRLDPHPREKILDPAGGAAD
jgi:hypothetical protein